MRCFVSLLAIWRYSCVALSQSLSVSVVGLFYLLFFLVWKKISIVVAWLFGKFFWTDSSVRTVYDCKYHFLVDSIQFYLTGLKADAWKYLIRSSRFFVWTTLFTCLVISTWRFFFLLFCCEGGDAKAQFDGLYILLGYCFHSLLF